MNLFYVFFALLLPHSGGADKNTLPVFMIDQDRTMSHIIAEPNPFDKTSTSKFAHIIHDSMKHGICIIIFVEDSFSVNDISLKDKFGSPFNHLRQSIQEKKAKYFPAVIEPYKLLTQIFPPQKFNVFYLQTRTKLELMDSMRYIYIYFQDGLNETRAEVLRRHDFIINEVCSVVRKLKEAPIIAFYTGKMNPVQMEKLVFVPIKPIPVPKNMGVLVASAGGLFRFSDVFAASPSRRSAFNQKPMISEERFTRRTMSTKMAYADFELEFNFSFLRTEWLLDNVVLLEAGEEVGRTVMGVGAPWNMSYVCGEPIVIVNSRDGSAVTISQYQIQPRRKHYLRDEEPANEPASEDVPIITSDVADADTGGPAAGMGDSGMGGLDAILGPGGKLNLSLLVNMSMADIPADIIALLPPELLEQLGFGKSVHCGRYFTSSAITILMVSIICFLILIYGIVCMMDIKSNSRYEDPQSKPLVHPEN